MKKGSILLTLVLIVVVIIIAAGAYMVGKREAVAPVVADDVINVDRSIPDEEPAMVAQIKLPYIYRHDGSGKYPDGEKVGCDDRLIYVPVNIKPTTAPLNAAYRELFAAAETFSYQGWQLSNPIAYQVTKKEFPKLVFERAEIKNGIANVYLRGSLTGVGTCYDPLPALQLNAVASQFPTVKGVRYYLNNKPFDPASIADQR